MRNIIRKTILMSGIALTLSISNIYAQSYEWISSTEGNTWQQAKIKLQTKAAQAPVLDIDGSEDGTTFKAWGTCFNELGSPATLFSRRRLEIQYGTFFHECQ